MSDDYSLKLLILAVVAILVALAYPKYQEYKKMQYPVPPGVTLSGIPAQGKTKDEVVRELHDMFSIPASLKYGVHTIIIRPRDINFKVDVDKTLKKAQEANKGWRYWVNFALFLANRPFLPKDVPVEASWDPLLLGNWMLKVSQKYDHPAEPPRGIVETMTFVPGKEGTQLSMEGSAKAVIDALKDPYRRERKLVIKKVPAPQPSAAVLADLVRRSSKDFKGVVSLYTQLLSDGSEAGYNDQVAFAAMSTIKVPIGLLVLRKKSLPLDSVTRDLMVDMLGKSGNQSSNELLGMVDDGDPKAGCKLVTDFLRKNGFVNTYIAAPYFSHPPEKELPTPANQHKTLDTKPDTAMQTTARDMGRFIAEVARCAEGKGKFASVSGLSPEKCQRLLEFMSLEEQNMLMTAGMPPGTKVIHKHGFIKDSYGDVGIVWGPKGEFSLAVYLYHPPEMPWKVGSTMMQRLARGVWNYYALLAGKRQVPWEAQ